MPWADLTYEHKIEIYKEILKEHIEAPRNADLVVHEIMIQSQILRHDFTKRQLIIIAFIMSLSFSLGKWDAYIPKTKDFSLAGISDKHINAELKKLLSMKIIKWNKEEKLFSIEDPRKWDSPYNVGYNFDRARDLFYLNLEQADVDIKPFLEKKKKK